MAYWHANYWQANYWQANYWAVANVGASGNYWSTTYWNSNYWNPNYWAGDVNVIDINVPAAGTRVLSAQVPSIDISLEVRPGTAQRTLTPLQAAAANNVTVTNTLATRKLTGININADPGEYYEGDINFVLLASSAFSWTDGIPATTGSKTLTSINPAVTGGTGDVAVQITSTPAKTLTPFVTTARNPVVVRPLTPAKTLAKFNVTTGFGTLVNADIGSKTLTPRQTNVIATGADINEIDITIASKVLGALDPSVTAGTAARRKGGRTRKMRYIIEIGGEIFEVDSVQEGLQLLKEARELAEEAAQKATDKTKVPRIRIRGKASKTLSAAAERTQRKVDRTFEKARFDFRRKIAEMEQQIDGIQASLERIEGKKRKGRDDAIAAALLL